MFARRLIRWKSFWLGILVLGVLGWAWIDGVKTTRACGLNVPWGSIGVAQVQGRLGAQVQQRPSKWSFVVRAYPRRPAGRWLPTSTYDATWSGKRGSMGSMDMAPYGHLYVAHWLLILLFLVPWLAFLFWRIRRQRKQRP
jgi:hypothetical protein